MIVGVGADERAQAASREVALLDYRRRGLGMLPALIHEQRVNALLDETDRLWRMFDARGAADLRAGIRVQPSGEVRVDRLDPVADFSPLFADLNADRDLVALAESGLGAHVVVMKEKLIYRPPGTVGFGLHRDADYNTPRTGIPGNEFFTVAIALDPVPVASGPTEFFPDLRHAVTPRPAGEPRDIDVAALAGQTSVMPELRPGDGLIFDGLIPHRSAPNESERPRRTYMITYVNARHSRAREIYYAARIEEEGRNRRRLLEADVSRAP
jgi:ectoine hydroxylase-related dioxygenase (phytanoyl-CoA dioxygenase family)